MGYPAEEHVVETDDGYLLTMHRIPGSVGASPVLLQHGLVCSSFDWVVSGKGKALGNITIDIKYLIKEFLSYTRRVLIIDFNFY